MKILFIVSTLYLNEPLGPMILMSLAMRHGHIVQLAALDRVNVLKTIMIFKPDIVAYSAMTSEIPLFKACDDNIRMHNNKSKKIFRIMGGAHPTYNPEIIEEMKLDAICQGDGEIAFLELIERISMGKSFDDIPNIAVKGEGAYHFQLFSDLDSLPFPERKEVMNLSPYLRKTGLRSIITSRGCPYNCTYCYNHAYNKIFRNTGIIIRRRSVENVIKEIECVIKKYPPVNMIRFCDDTFAYTADDWLKNFSKEYKKRIQIPFYCLMRSNTLDDETAQLLSSAGCYSMSMSIESGNETIRNDILKRNISNETLVKSFACAKKHGIRVLANTMIAIPGTSIVDDLDSMKFARSLHTDVPSFGICCPFPGTDIWRMAINRGILENEKQLQLFFSAKSVLNCYTEVEKNIHQNIQSLGILYCKSPIIISKLIYKIILINKSTLLRHLGRFYNYYKYAFSLFPFIIPRNVAILFSLVVDTIRMWSPMKKKVAAR